MPKPKYNKPSWKNQYSEQDFRGGDRRVVFKSNRQNRRDNNKDWATSIRQHLQDEDCDMGGTSTSGTGRSFKKSNFKRRGRGDSPAPNYQKRKLMDGPMGWFKIIMPYGNKYEKDFILKTLMERMEPMPLWPMLWRTNGNVASFFVDDFKTAEKLHDLDRQIQMPDGFQLIISARALIPNVDLNKELKEKIKIAMARRYNPSTKALDLTKFHRDPDLQNDFCALFKPIIFIAVVDIIAENIPEIEAINLFDNKISHFSYLKKITTKLPQLKILHMGNNKDGIDLPPPISFDLAEETPLPPSCQTFLCSPEGEPIVRQFLEQYFLIYDTEDRQPLINAYHESAVFSLTMAYPYGQKDKSVDWLNAYTSENRNILRVTDPVRRNKLLKQGRVAVVAFLQEDMPQTKHDKLSFTVDLVLFTPQMMSLNITGMFKELKSGHKVPPIRYFFRTLLIVPAGAGFCIINESLHITNATEEQAKLAFKIPEPPPIVVPPPVQAAVVSPVVAVPEPDDLTKQQMVQAMSQQSGMNLEWSEKCLLENKWDFQRSVEVFHNLHKLNSIPSEAFIK